MTSISLAVASLLAPANRSSPTVPTFNSVLAPAGAVVTEQGGLLCHTAVVARELGIPGIVGVAGALDIPDGAEVLVDPVADTVRQPDGV